MSKLIRKVEICHVQIFLISFFIALFFIGCRQRDTSTSVILIWKDNKAIGLSIPQLLIKQNSVDGLKVQLVKPGERFAVFGNFTIESEQIRFEPTVPLTRGFKYEVLLTDSVLAEIEVPFDETVISPELLSVYPTQDTVPENLLKIFLHFSQPMVEGQSLHHLTLLKSNRDTLIGTFLDLQPELWNKESTVLTLWLDPGRIKRDLIPNKELGAPLNAYEHYTLHVPNDWKSKEGKTLAAPYSKTFVTSIRDDESPSPEQWVIHSPTSATKQFLEINLKEPLDYSLLNDAIRIVDSEGNSVAGTIQLDREETIFRFLPKENWEAGHYTLIIEGRLEDLAGNNLNRPFDNDLKSPGKRKPHREVFEKVFHVQ